MDLEYSVNLPFLRLLHLNGCIEKIPKWIRSLNGLNRLMLSWSRLRENTVQDLPNLVNLHIPGAYVEGLRFEAQGFKKLKELFLADLNCLKWMTVEKGSMPGLQQWFLGNCKLVTKLFPGIEHLCALQDLRFADMGDEFVERVVEEKKNEGVHWRLSHVAQVRFYNMMSNGYMKFDFEL